MKVWLLCTAALVLATTDLVHFFQGVVTYGGVLISDVVVIFAVFGIASEQLRREVKS